MKNPCIDCLVKPMCSEVCSAKRNYGRLLSQAVEENRTYFFSNVGNKELRKNYQYWRGRQAVNKEEIVKIETKSRDIGRHEE